MKKTIEMNGKPLEIDTEDRIIVVPDQEGQSAIMYMPGLDDLIMIPVGGDGWQWNNNTESPTFSPSILTHIERGEERALIRNHVFVKSGMIQFLPDCSHELAGHIEELPKVCDWPEEMKLWDE